MDTRLPFGDCGFADAFLRTYPFRVLCEEAFEQAAKILDQERPGNWFRHRQYYAWWIRTERDARALLAHLQTLKVSVGFDTETTRWSPKKVLKGVGPKAKSTKGLSPWHNSWRPDVVVLQLSWGQANYVIDSHLIYLFEDWLTNQAKLVGANVGFDLAALRAKGSEVRRFHQDVLHMSYTLDEVMHQKLRGLKDVAAHHLGVDTIHFDEVAAAVAVERYEIPSVPQPQYTKTGKLKKTRAPAKPKKPKKLEATGENFAAALYGPSPDAVISYAAQDPWITIMSADVLAHKLRALESQSARTGVPWTMLDVYHRLETGYLASVIEMEAAGMPINVDAAKRHMDRLKVEIEKVTAEAYKIIGKPVNLGSAADLRDYYLYKAKKPVQITNTGHICLACNNKTITAKHGHVCPEHGRGFLINTPATGKAAIELWAKNGDELGAKLMLRRKLDKQASTWVDGFTRLSNMTDRAHPPLRASDVVTGRLSGGIFLTSPAELRDVLGLPDGVRDRLLVGGDYSQLELRVLAMVSGDASMLAAFLSGKDAHTWSGAIIEAFEQDNSLDATSPAGLQAIEAAYARILEAVKLKDELEKGSGKKLSPEHKRLLSQRKRGKTINFGIVYGMSIQNLAEKLDCTESQAGQLYAAVWSAYSGAATFFAEQLALTRAREFMFTILGRRAHLPEINSARSGARGHAERRVKNTPCQGGAGDIVRLAQIRCLLDMEAGGVFGTTGRKMFGTWTDGRYEIDNWEKLPWYGKLPATLQEDFGLLGKLGALSILQCHDELIFDVPIWNAARVRQRLRIHMLNALEDVVETKVPFVSEPSAGRCWSELK